QNCLSVPWKVHTYFFRKKGRKQPRRGSTRIGGGRCEEMKGYSPENCELSTKNWFFGQNQSPVLSCQFLVAHLATETHSEPGGLAPQEGRASPGNGVPRPKTSADDYNGREPRVPRSASLHSPDPAYSRAAHTVHRHDGGFRSPGRWRKSPASHRVKSLLAWLLLPLCGHCHCGGTLL